MANADLTLRDIAQNTALTIIVGGALWLGLALLAELARRHRSDSALVRAADRVLPSITRRIAVGIFTFVSATLSVAGPSTASADASLRDWLTSPAAPTSTTTTVVPVGDSGPAESPGQRRRPPAQGGRPEAFAVMFAWVS